MAEFRIQFPWGNDFVVNCTKASPDLLQLPWITSNSPHNYAKPRLQQLKNF